MKALFFGIIFTITLLGAMNLAHGDGLTQENLPPASVGDREASLFIKISPAVLTKDTIGDTYLEMRLFDAKTDETIQHTSFFVTVDKGGELLMRNLFHTHSGNLRLKIQPTDVALNDVKVFGDQEPFQGGWTSTNDQISVKAPILLEAGLYHFEIEIFGIDNDRNIFIPQDAPKFDSWLSVGDIFDEEIDFKGTSYPVAVTSYYDVIDNFKFDEKTKTVSFSMPFNWDIQRLEKQNIFVHEEIHFPNSFSEFTKSPLYTATVNGFPITGRMLIADPYSAEDTLILHFLLSKDNILSIAKTVPANADTMEFALSPSSNAEIGKSAFQIDFPTGARASINFGKNFVAGQSVPFDITFFDKDSKLLKFVRYGYSIENSKGTNLFESLGDDSNAVGILSTEGIDKHEFTFPSQGTYKLNIAIFSHGIDDLQTYSGIAGKKFEITSDETSNLAIPSWIKNNAGWWKEGKIGDNDFVQGIQWLIQNKIMIIPASAVSGESSGQSIPSWIKNNAGWWKEGKIGDNDFVQGIQWLISNGVIKI